MTRLKGKDWQRSPERADLLRLMSALAEYQQRTGDRFVNYLGRLKFNYAAAPECLTLPHGPERLRKAYELYLAEAREGEEVVPYNEGRKALRSWSGDYAPKRGPRKG
jgi:hypothetical protein